MTSNLNYEIKHLHLKKLLLHVSVPAAKSRIETLKKRFIVEGKIKKKKKNPPRVCDNEQHELRTRTGRPPVEPRSVQASRGRCVNVHVVTTRFHGDGAESAETGF